MNKMFLYLYQLVQYHANTFYILRVIFDGCLRNFIFNLAIEFPVYSFYDILTTYWVLIGYLNSPLVIYVGAGWYSLIPSVNMINQILIFFYHTMALMVMINLSCLYGGIQLAFYCYVMISYLSEAACFLSCSSIFINTFCNMVTTAIPSEVVCS